MTANQHLEKIVSEYNIIYFSKGDFHRHAYLREQMLGGNNVLILSVPNGACFWVDIPAQGLDSFSTAEDKHYEELLQKMLMVAMDTQNEYI